MYALRAYQQEAVDATLSHFRKTNAPAVIVLPTGAGKSLVIAELARLAKQKILVLAHVKELVAQNYEKYQSLGLEAGIYAAGLKSKQIEYQITFASVQSVSRNLAAFKDSYSLIIIDECHRVASDESGQYGGIIQHLTKQNAELKVLGLTATPYRLGMGWIYQYHYHGIKRCEHKPPFEKCIFELPLSYMIKHNFLTPPKLIDAPVAQYDFSSLSSNNSGEFNEQEVNALLVKYPRVTQAIIEQVITLSVGRQGVMIFAATIKHAMEILGYLPEQSTALVTGKTPAKDRDTLIAQFKRKQLTFLVNVSVLTTGFDAPHVDLIAILRPTQSVSLYQQIVGRGLRLSSQKKDCLVIDYAGNGINIFYPEVGQKKPSSDSELVQVFCPACGFANAFWGKTDGAGNITEHYGRKCQGVFESEDDRIDCDYRFRFKECNQCNAQNDIAARECHQCGSDIIDPDEQLKKALRLKDAKVIRCAGMSAEQSGQNNEKLVLIYHDEDGVELKETFDFSHNGSKQVFNRLFGKRFKQGAEPKTFHHPSEVISQITYFSHPDFVVARKAKHYWKIQEKIFDYEGSHRKANHL
ncbi:DEAD/DEAH box helicase [Flocculibacter collagenilyticus]|uniref:DEAD/DEAH box helicase n=1 Tax=Flocculibacter collagenilyticus TaxID=2744479 RepID=UPI0018F3480A|nr:DEAD/DEAH box helicase [Flocculibacter collagenilyticus]